MRLTDGSQIKALVALQGFIALRFLGTIHSPDKVYVVRVFNIEFSS